MQILITGGAGYIGSTIASALIDAGHTVIIVDNFSTGRREFVHDRIVYEGDIADPELISQIFRDYPSIYCAIHCAASILVPESVVKPIEYYKNNVYGTLSFIENLLHQGCHRVIFSSSASLYAVRDNFSVDETCPLQPSSPYARTKAAVENMLEDIAHGTAARVLSLRYFNPIGADPQLRSGLQTPSPSHIMGKLIHAYMYGTVFYVTGHNYPTRDGTGIRDYVHVWDLAQAHVLAVMQFDQILTDHHYRVINLGTGTGITVQELLTEFSKVVGQELSVIYTQPREGDTVGAFSVSDRAAQELGWRPHYSLAEAISDSIRWFAIRTQIMPDLR